MAFNSISSLQLTTINSITHPKVTEKIADNITASIPFLHELNRIGNKEYESGGTQYRINVFKELQDASAYTGLTVFGDSAEADPVTQAIYERKMLTIPVIISGTNLLKNSGADDTAIISYLTTQLEAAQESMKGSLAGSSIGIMSSQSDSDLGITGLQTYLSSSASTGTVGTLSRATYSWWRHYVAAHSAWSTGGIAAMRTAFLNLTRGDESPNLIITTLAGYSNFMRMLTGTVQYNGPVGSPASMDVDSQAISFHGAKVLWDSYCLANRIYYVNSKYFKLIVHKDRDCSIREFISPTNQDAIQARMYWAGNLVCTALKMQGVNTGTTIDTYS